MYNKQFFFSLLKIPGLRNKKIINIKYLIIVLIKMRLLIFLILSQYGLTSKCGVLFHEIELHFLIPGVTITKQATV